MSMVSIVPVTFVPWIPRCLTTASLMGDKGGYGGLHHSQCLTYAGCKACTVAK